MSTAQQEQQSGGPAKPDYKRIQYMVQGREGLEFRLGPNKWRGELVCKDDPDERFASVVDASGKVQHVRDFQYAPRDGARVALVTNAGCDVYDTDSGSLLCKMERPGLFRVALSPLGSFLLSWEKFVPGTENNMKVWRVADGEVVFQKTEKHLLGTTWPFVKWSDDERVAAYMVTNNVYIYDGHEFGSFVKIRQEGVTQFSMFKNEGEVSERNPVKVVTFKPETNSSPARISVFNFSGEATETPVGSKTTFKASEAAFSWSPLGNAVLVRTETDVDTTGQSYYGESALYLLHADGQYDCKILPAKDDGPFHDFAWSPAGKVFVAISGRSPAASVLYNLKGDAIFDFGQAHRNTIRFSPHGRFLCLGGFGNLSGDMDFWDMNKKSKMGSTRANCAVSQEWSPCGRFFMTGTLFPRMRVDNGLTFYTYRGEELYTVGVREATKAIWRPAAPGVYPDRPQTPLKKGQAAPSSQKAAAPAAPKAQAYRPPGSTGSLAAMMRKERDGSNAPRSLSQLSSAGGLGGGGTRGAIPGSALANESSGPKPGQKSKAALRRERKKKAEAARKAAEAAGAADSK